jgi:malonyl-CoA/methylmalonyl-CoA synthetase
LAFKSSLLHYKFAPLSDTVTAAQDAMGMQKQGWEQVRASCNGGFAQLVQSRISDPATPFIEADDGRSFSYGEYWELAGRLAHALQRSGVKRGDRVALQVEKSVEAIALFLACARLGAIFLPLNSAYTAAEVSYFLGDAEPALLIVTPGREHAFASTACCSVLTLDDKGGGSLSMLAADCPAAFDDAVMGWDDGLAILYTSGTTGKSKGALLTHANLASNAVTLVAAWGFTDRDVLIHALPVYHTHGLFVAVNTLILSGGRLLYRRKFDADDVLKLMPQATCLMGVPTFYTRLVSHPGLSKEAVSHMRLFISGSAPLLAETHRDFEAATGHAILERYGMTETNMITSNPLAGARKAGTVGPPLAGVEVRITDPLSGTQLAGDDVGMIEVRGPNIFQGYWRNPEKTAVEKRADGFFITGDFGNFDADGYLVISGRGKDLIISGGLNVYPKEVEAELDSQPEILESAVIGVPHPDFGEAVVAVVVVREGKVLDKAACIALAGQVLAKFKLPKQVLAVAEMPRNTMGKVQKAELRQRFSGLYDSPKG